MDDIFSETADDDAFLPPVTTAGKKFQPKPRFKPKKYAAKNEKVELGQDVVVEDKEPVVSISVSKKKLWEVEAEVPHGEAHVLKGVSKVSTMFEMEVDPLFHPMPPWYIDVAEAVSASNLCSSSSVPVDISSAVSEVQEPINLSSGLLTHEMACQDTSQVSEREGNAQSHPVKPEEEAMPVLSGIKEHVDIFSESTDIAAVKKVSKFQPKDSSKPKQQKKSVSFIFLDAAESVSKPNKEESMSFSLPDADKVQHTPSTISDSVDLHLDQRCGNVDVADVSDLESFDSILSKKASVSGKAAPKFRPKPGAQTKAKTEKSNHSDNSNGAKETISHSDSPPMDTEPLEDHDLSVPTETLTNLAYEQAEPVEMSSLEAGSPEFEPIDTLDGDHWNDEEQAEAENRDLETLHNSHMDEYLNDDDYRGEDKPKQKKQPKRAKKQVTDAQEPSKRLRKASKKPDSIKTEPPKKRFPHGTRRKRRQLDKNLLETPEFEIDLRQIAIKQLILLGEAKEKYASKQATSSGNNQSNTGSFPNDSRYDPDNPFDEELHRNDTEKHLNELRSAEKVNYHSHMNKVQRGKWSKSETELFYEAIRQFGTDFGMIEKLFPNRTRHQVKLKFKNEERRHPSELRDAMSHRSKDLSHFEMVIQQLKAQAEEESRQDDANKDPTSTSQDTANANKDERNQPEKEEKEADEFEEVLDAEWNADEWNGDDTTELNEYEDFECNTRASSTQNEEKYSEYDELY